MTTLPRTPTGLTLDECETVLAHTLFAAVRCLRRYREADHFSDLPAAEQSRFRSIARMACALADPETSVRADVNGYDTVVSLLTEQTLDDHGEPGLKLLQRAVAETQSELLVALERQWRQTAKDYRTFLAHERAMRRDPAFPDVAVRA